MTVPPQIPPNRRAVGVFALDGVQGLDVTGPMEVFAVANRFGARYEVFLISATGAPIRTHAGPELGPAVAMEGTPAGLDTLVVAGGCEAVMREAQHDRRIFPWLHRQATSARRVVSICTGAFVLAAAGLLAGRRATTHWARLSLFAEMFPDVSVDCDAIYVADPPFYTSAGVTAGLDLSLALVEADFGHEVALRVARELVLFLRRPGGQSQFSAAAELDVEGPPRVVALAHRLIENPAKVLKDEGRRVADLAEATGMSERTFVRAFVRCTGLSPGRFIETARTSFAKKLLETGDEPLERVAARAGFGSADALGRAFSKHAGITPSDYRRRFGRASGLRHRPSPADAHANAPRPRRRAD
jgi:transcriptional regulator GlxA family with amidase domain